MCSGRMHVTGGLVSRGLTYNHNPVFLDDLPYIFGYSWH